MPHLTTLVLIAISINQSINQSIFITPEGSTETHNKMLQKQTQSKN